MGPSDERVAAVIAQLLLQREPAATICPSEAARALQPDDWRPLMPQVREVAIALAKKGRLVIKQGGRVVPPGRPLHGPVRLGRVE